jgi:hypothetical protein
MDLRTLEWLKSEDFAVSVGFLLPPPALRRTLAATREVQEITRALAEGDITEEMIRKFVSSLLSDLHKGERFPHDLALAALAVALENSPLNVAVEFLRDLSTLQLAEMSVSIRVARECLKHRVVLSNNHQDEKTPRTLEKTDIS